MLQKAFKDECMGKTQIKEWYRRFKSGRTSVVSDPRSGRPSTGTSSDNVERVRVAVEQDRHLTVRELEDELGIPKSTVWRILTENFGMTRVCGKCSSAPIKPCSAVFIETQCCAAPPASIQS